MPDFLPEPNRANTGGFPLLKGIPSVDATSGNLVITFEPHAALQDTWTGGFWVWVDGAITSSADQPVVFATRGVNGVTPVYLFGGIQATAATLATSVGGQLLCFWNAVNGRLQIIGA